jgi:hypothetical protein
MLDRLKLPLVVVTLSLLIAWAPSSLHAQTTDPGQQGEFQGENTDTGAAAVDQANEKETPETSEAAAATAARTSVLAAPSSAAEAADSEPAESGTDLDRVEDQVGDQTGPDSLTL